MRSILFGILNDLLSVIGLKVTRPMVSLSDFKLLFTSHSVDNTRTDMLELVAYEINLKKINGHTAELGVYRGDFAKHINYLFPDRKLYLFDTFEGFDKRDISNELENNLSSGSQDFSDTNIDIALSKMTHPSNCIVKKGFFPETVRDLDSNILYAFVSIDTDLYSPILSGLEYFYPRLSTGGYIFVHDFNNSEYSGARKAVLDFCKNYNVPYVPISDGWGTVVIAK